MQISVTFCVQPVTEGDITGYRVHYNGRLMEVNSPTTALTFNAPSLPHDVFTGTVVVMVAATNEFGIGPISDPVTATINGTVLLVMDSFCESLLIVIFDL